MKKPITYNKVTDNLKLNTSDEAKFTKMTGSDGQLEELMSQKIEVNDLDSWQLYLFQTGVRNHAVAEFNKLFNDFNKGYKESEYVIGKTSEEIDAHLLQMKPSFEPPAVKSAMKVADEILAGFKKVNDFWANIAGWAFAAITPLLGIILGLIWMSDYPFSISTKIGPTIGAAFMVCILSGFVGRHNAKIAEKWVVLTIAETVAYWIGGFFSIFSNY